jgi:hypothetical protein
MSIGKSGETLAGTALSIIEGLSADEWFSFCIGPASSEGKGTGGWLVSYIGLGDSGGVDWTMLTDAEVFVCCEGDEFSE